MRRYATIALTFGLGMAAGLAARPAPAPRTPPVPDAVTVTPPRGQPADLAVYRYQDSGGAVLTRPADVPPGEAWVFTFRSGDDTYRLTAAPPR